MCSLNIGLIHEESWTRDLSLSCLSSQSLHCLSWLSSRVSQANAALHTEHLIQNSLLISLFRIIEYSELKGTHKDHEGSTLHPTKDTPKITPCAWEHCPNVSWILSGCCCDHFSWGPDHPLGEEPLLIRSLSLPWHTLRPYPWVLSLGARVKTSVPAPPFHLMRKLQMAMTSPQSRVLQAEMISDTPPTASPQDPSTPSLSPSGHSPVA